QPAHVRVDRPRKRSSSLYQAWAVAHRASEEDDREGGESLRYELVAEIVEVERVPASTAVTILRREPVERMMSFSTSTTRKKIRPPTRSHGQTQKGIASLSNKRCSGGA